MPLTYKQWVDQHPLKKLNKAKVKGEGEVDVWYVRYGQLYYGVASSEKSAIWEQERQYQSYLLAHERGIDI